MSDEKRCFKCGRSLPISEFYAHPMMGDGHLGKCKECARKDVRENRASKRLQYARYERERFKRPERKRDMVRRSRLHREANPNKAKARAMVEREVLAGRLQRNPCEICGEPKTHAHHDDYSKPLEVRWLCVKHHMEAHGKVYVADQL